MIHAFADGGCIGANPSTHGGTWAWCLVGRHNVRVKEAFGVILPADVGLPKVTNNVSELLAAILAVEGALECCGKDWRGTLHTDSLVTLRRLTTGHSFKGVPQNLRTRALDLRRGRKWAVTLLAGHPTKADLLRGHKDCGRPVSGHNAWCDDACRQAARAHLAAHGKV